MEWDIDEENEKVIYTPPKIVSPSSLPKKDAQNTPEKAVSSDETPKDTTISENAPKSTISVQIPTERPSVVVRRGHFLEFLVSSNYISPVYEEIILVEAQASSLPVETVVSSRQYISPENLLKALSEYYKLPIYKKDKKIDEDMLLKNMSVFTQHSILPLDDNFFVISDPLFIKKYESIISTISRAPKFLLSYKKTIKKLIQETLIKKRITPSELNRQIIRLYNEEKYSDGVLFLIEYMYSLNASDIHFECAEKAGLIRARINGVLESITSVGRDVYDRLVRAVHSLSGGNTPAESDAGDGSFAVSNLPLVIRTSLFPSLYKTHNCVLRLLPTESEVPTYEDLGYSEEIWNVMLSTVRNASSGLILFVGPTGSGKSTSLFTLVNALDTRKKKLIEVANPVEYRHLVGIQANLTETENITFNYARALRAALRHDVDILLVGEIRDSESAEIALHAARTGHLVLSTIHADSAFEAFDRLADSGCDIRNVLQAAKLIVSQRLVRKLCQHCLGKGCPSCFNGFTGRIALPETLVVSQALKEALRGSLPPTAGEREALAKNHCPHYIPLKEIAAQAVNKQLTTREEILRVIGE